MSFLECFFGAGNAIAWTAVEDPASATRKRLEPFLGLVEKGARVAFLPRTVQGAAGQPGHLRWYFLCRDAAAGRRARELMRAFLGPSFVLIADRLSPLNVADPVDAAVLDAYGQHSFWVAVPSQWPVGSPLTAAPHDVVRTRLETMAKLLERRPVRTLTRRRPVGRVLRDFEFAMTARDVETARSCLAELAATGDLTAANRKFLSVRIDGVRQAWDELLDPTRLAEILDLGPPRAVVQVLVDAFYAKHLQALDDPGKAAEALKLFKARRPVYGRLFRSRVGLSGRSADFCFVLEAAGFADRPHPMIESILSGAPEGPGRAALLAVGALVPMVPAAVLDPAQRLSRALERFNDGDLDEALELVLPAPHAFRRTALLVRIAAELQTTEPAAAALEALERSSREDLGRLEKSKALSVAAEKVRELASSGCGERPIDWFLWLERLQRSEPWSGAVSAASAGEKGWDIRAVAETPDAIDRFTALIERKRPEWGQRAFRDAAPFLVRALGTTDQGPGLRPIHETLFLQLATDQDASAPQWCALADLVELQVSYGLDATSYEQQVDALGSLLGALGSSRMVLPALTFFERLCDLACASAEARLRFATRLHVMLSSLPRRVDRCDLVLFASLVRPVGLQVEVPAEPEAAPDAERSLDALRGKTVALYSLNARALERARSALAEEAPEVNVKCFSDTKGGGQALAHAARSADLFVIATAAATHAATGFIDQHRGELPKRRVHRQGAAALLSAVRTYAEECQRGA